MYVPLDITALSNSVPVYVGRKVPDIIGILLDGSIPEGPVHVMATPIDETLANSVLNSTAQVRTTSIPEMMGLSMLLVTVTMVGPGTASAWAYIIIEKWNTIIQPVSLLNS